MGGFTYGAWAQLGAANATIAAANSTVFGTVDNAGKTGSEISVQVTYNASATQGARIQIERDIDGTGFEGESSAPWVIPVPFTAGATRERNVFVDGASNGKFRVRVVNLDTGQAVTNANVRVKQATYA